MLGSVMDDGVEPVAQDIQLPRVLAALADPHRLAAVRFVARHGESWCAQVIEEAGLPMTKPTFSHHLSILREAASSPSGSMAPGVICRCARTTWTGASPASWTPSSPPTAKPWPDPPRLRCPHHNLRDHGSQADAAGFGFVLPPPTSHIAMIISEPGGSPGAGVGLPRRRGCGVA